MQTVKQRYLASLFKNFRRYGVHLRACPIGSFSHVHVSNTCISYSYLLTALSTGVSTYVLALVSILFSEHTPRRLSLVYTNSFLTTLNSRSTFADEFELNATSQGSTARSINFRIMAIQETIQDEEQAEKAACDVSFSKTNAHAKIRRGSLLTKGRIDGDEDF